MYELEPENQGSPPTGRANEEGNADRREQGSSLHREKPAWEAPGVLGGASQWSMRLQAHAAASSAFRSQDAKGEQSEGRAGLTSSRAGRATACANMESIPLRSWVRLPLPLWRTPVNFLPGDSHSRVME